MATLREKISRMIRAAATQKIEAIGFTARAEITPEVAAAEGKAAQGPRFSILAYTGGPLRLNNFPYPVIVDMSGLKATAGGVKVFRDHLPSQIVGHADGLKIDAAGVRITGPISGVGAHAAEVIASAKNGFPWEASIGASPNRIEFLAAGKTAVVNDRTVTGPAHIVRDATLKEVSFVALGADENTAASVAASHPTGDKPGSDEHTMNFHDWLKALGFDPATLTQAQTTKLQAKFDAEVSASVKGREGNDGAGEKTNDIAAQIRAEAAAETKRIAAIRAAAGNHAEIAARAIEEGWDQTKVELEVLRAERPKAPAGHVGDTTINASVLEAALLVAGRHTDAEKLFDDKTLQAAHNRFRNHLGLQELIMQAAWANGYHGTSYSRDPQAVMRAAFSTNSLPGILSNVASKFLLQGFNYVERVWREVTAVRSVSDLKQVTSYRMTGSDEFEAVGPDGELKHAKLGEESYTNQAKTHGIILSITDDQIINDDLGALTAMPTRIGRGAGLKLNTVFWAAFMDNSSFFSTGNKNYISGSTTTLDETGLSSAETKFMAQVDKDGKPIGGTPAILLTPIELSLAAQKLYAQVVPNSAANANVYAGRYRPIASRYLSNAKFTGNSSKAWYLLANPLDLPVIETVFFLGQETPTIETARANFNTLGIEMRGHLRFGVAKQDPRGGVKSKGEN